MTTIQAARKGLWGRLRSPSARYSVLTLFGGGIIAGIILWGGFNTGLEATNNLDFCISCHEMESTVYQEYKKTIHYSNRSGVRATCPDCHVPRDWTHKMMRKIQASQEVWGKITGTISTKEKFEAKRLELAQHEWKRMKDSNSRECRNCHTVDGMNPDAQKQRARKQHEELRAGKATCIDCHKGIAHQRPKGMKEEDDE
jgi:cytochrome c-type protein NapC